MSSIRVSEATVGDKELKVLDAFMLSLGCELSPGADIGSERANMPWSQRWYRPMTVTYTDMTKGHLYLGIDTARWLYETTEAIPQPPTTPGESA